MLLTLLILVLIAQLILVVRILASLRKVVVIFLLALVAVGFPQPMGDQDPGTLVNIKQ